jgi:hypothetical protein
MDRGDPAAVPGVNELKQIESFAAANLAESQGGHH